MLITAKIILILFILISILLSLVGFGGSVVLFIASLVYAYFTDFSDITSKTIITLLILTVFAEGIEMISGTIGAKKFDASKEAVWGSVIGLFIGFLIALTTFQFYMIVVGLIAGVVIGELKAGRDDFKTIMKSLIGVLVGKVGGIIIKTILTIAMGIILLFAIF